MPSTNTSHLPKTPVRLTGETCNTPTSDDTFITFTLGHTNKVNHLIFLENSFYWNLLLKESISIVYLLSNCTTIDLDLHQVCFLLLQSLHLGNLSVSQDTDHRCIFLQLLKLLLDGLLCPISFILFKI